MACVLKIMELACGDPSEFDGKFVQKYDPTFREADGSYEGGILEVCDDPKNAKQFASAAEAMECWRQSFGLRPDGKPNSPLTAWSVLVDPIAG